MKSVDLHRVLRTSRLVIVLFLLVAGVPTDVSATPSLAVALSWSTCGSCPDPAEVAVSGDTVSLGVAGRSESSSQNNARHGASALLPPAEEYIITFDYALFTWDSYNPREAGWTGYWDSFSLSVSDRPYWQLPLTDPITPSNLPGLRFIWGGTRWADGIMERASGTRTITVNGNSSGNNYLNVILDTATLPDSNHAYPSWGTITIRDIRLDAGASTSNDVADLAKDVVGSDYLWGGKGWNYQTSRFADTQQIKVDGYRYYNPTKAPSPGLDFGKGIDCSGLILWAHNKAAGSATMLGGPVKYEGADGQYRNNSAVVAEADLRPGDLLFFNWDGDGDIDHVAMYVGDHGGSDVVHASRPGVGVVWANKNDMKSGGGFAGFRRIQSASVGLSVTAHSPVELIVTDPDGFTIDRSTIVETEEEILVEIPGVLYYSMEAGLDDTVFAPILKPGIYTIRVRAKPDASPMDTYSLEVEGASKLVVLAQDVLVSDIPPFGYQILSTGDEIAPLPPMEYQPVGIDVFPGKQIETQFSPTSSKWIPVAVLGSPDFNVSAVEHSSLRMGPANAVVRPERWVTKDLDGDGDVDLMVWFRPNETGISCSDTNAMVIGQTQEGLPFAGTDSIITTGCP